MKASKKLRIPWKDEIAASISSEIGGAGREMSRVLHESTPHAFKGKNNTFALKNKCDSWIGAAESVSHPPQLTGLSPHTVVSLVHWRGRDELIQFRIKAFYILLYRLIPVKANRCRGELRFIVNYLAG
jgi:hypothetical protein